MEPDTLDPMSPFSELLDNIPLPCLCGTFPAPLAPPQRNPEFDPQFVPQAGFISSPGQRAGEAPFTAGVGMRGVHCVFGAARGWRAPFFVGSCVVIFF